MKQKINLGVNIDHAATLRQVRGGTTDYPDLLKLTKILKNSGAVQITIHLREDRRHIQDQDVITLCKKSPLPINLEMAVSNKMLKIALKNKPAWVCFVPEKREELTTEGGLNVEKYFSRLKKMTSLLKKQGIKISYFIEPSLKQIELSRQAGADAVEFHTGHWVLSNGVKKRLAWKSLLRSAEMASAIGLKVHAGHGLDYLHATMIKRLPFLTEVNIGHSLICYSLELGIKKAVKKMISRLK